MTPEFYQHFQTPRILIFQTDAGVVSKTIKIEQFFKYDYIGAPWVNAHIHMTCGNGGLSLRNTRLFEEICRGKNKFSRRINEDIFFSATLKSMKEMGINVVLPETKDEAGLFASETMMHNSWGQHSIFKHHPIENVRMFLHKDDDKF